MPLEITQREMNGIYLLALNGRLALGQESSGLLSMIDNLLASGATRMVINLQHVNYVDSAGLGALIEMQRKTKAKGGSLKPWISLGEHGEAIRQFLLGGSFPAEVAITITVLPPPVTLIAFHVPYETIGPDPTFHLYISGINCTLCIGSNIASELSTTSLHLHPHVLLVVDNVADITKKFRDMFQSASQRLQKPKQPSR